MLNRSFGEEGPSAGQGAMRCFLKSVRAGQEQCLGCPTVISSPSEDHASPLPNQIGYPELYPYCSQEFTHQPSINQIHPDKLTTNPHLDLDPCLNLDTKQHQQHNSFPEQHQIFIKPNKSHFNPSFNLATNPHTRPQSHKEPIQRSDCRYVSLPPCKFIQGTTLETSEINPGEQNECMVDVQRPEQNQLQPLRHGDGFINDSQSDLNNSWSDNRQGELPRSHFTAMGHRAITEQPDTTDHAPLPTPLATQGRPGGPQHQNTLFEISTRTTIPLLGDTLPLSQSYLGLLEEHPDNNASNGHNVTMCDTEIVSCTRNRLMDNIFRAPNTSCVWKNSGSDSHFQGFNKGQHPNHNPAVRDGCELGTSPRQDTEMMSGFIPSSRTCEAVQSRYFYQDSAGALPGTPFPRQAQTKPARHHGNIQVETMNNQSGEDNSMNMPPEQPPRMGQATEGTATGHWQPGARPRFEQVVMAGERHPRPGFRHRPRHDGDRAYQVPYPRNPTSIPRQPPRRGADIAASNQMTSSARAATSSLGFGQHARARHHLQALGNIRCPTFVRSSASDTSTQVSVTAETISMYTMGETCTINPTPFGGFGQEMKAIDWNLSGDIINFDFITQAQIDGFFNNTAPTDTQGGLRQEVEMEGSFNEMMPAQSPIKIEELGSVNVASHHQSQYDAEMDQVQQLIVREVMGDIVTACELINIPTDPYRWNSEQVKKWVEWTRHQYRLPEIEVGFFAMDGMSLCNLTDEQFRQISPKSGDILFAHLDIWKNAANRMNVADDILSPHLSAHQVFGDEQCSYMDLSSLGGYETSSSMSNSDDEVSIPSPGPTSGPNTFMTPNHTGSIHLWQFLKDLLVQPDSYGYCIRWLDRPQGIFKIEDSVEVARLWGLRKNRPAMNYDKLSRSIRQYYKKGIMKKTEIAQRLVYQFVHPC